MRILMIHPHDIHSRTEPWTRRIKSLAREFVKKGNEVKLVYYPLSNNGDRKIHFFEGYEAIPFNRYPSPVVFLKNTLELVNLGRWADIIHFQKCHHYASIPAVISAYLNRKPLHYDWDDWEEMIWYESCGKNLHSKFIGLSFKMLEKFLPVLADTVSVASRYLKELSIKFGVKEKNISFTPVGADLDEFNPNIVDRGEIKNKYNIDNPLILYIGQLHGAQYIDLFIKSANIVLHKYPEVTFMIVGEGFMLEELRKLAYGLGIEDRIIFSGSVSHHEIPKYIAAADICVATFRETKVTRCKSPLKIVEYMAMRKSIVASNVGEVKRMLGGVGVLVEPGNPHALAEGIIKILVNSVLRDNLERFSRQRVEHRFNWPNTADTLLNVYKKLCNSER